MSFSGFPPEALQFMRDLKENNNRDWFLPRKSFYEQKVKGPLIEFVSALKQEMGKAAPEIAFEPSGIFRIYRDIRFSNDKSPYKTHASVWFPAKGFEGESAGLYFHFDSKEAFLAGGLYHPSSAVLLAVRKHIAEHLPKLRKIQSDKRFRKMFGEIGGEKLTRAPKGFPTDHPASELLRHKDFIVHVHKPPRFVTSKELLPFAVECFKTALPLVRFLNAGIQRSPRKSF